jgi:alkylation response protein AidB-like acyl-CoA dehydrogenase
MLSTEQLEYGAAVRTALARYPRPATADDFDAARTTWAKSLRATLAGLGGFGLLVPEHLGGSGGSIVDMLVVLEETGRAGVDRWFLSSAVLSAFLLNREAEHAIGRELLAAVAGGDRLVTVALTEADGAYALGSIQAIATPTAAGFELSGSKCFVPAAHHADMVIVALRNVGGDDIGLYLVDRNDDGVTIDRSDPASVNGFASLHLDRVPIPAGRQFPVGLTAGDFDDLLAYGAVGTCAEMVGGAQKVLEMTVDYATAREQFGVPIGAYEMVQHHCVQLRTDVHAARVVTYRAGRALEVGSDDRHRLASVAKAWTSRAYRRITSVAHRVHGAIGFSEEHGLHRYTKAQMDAWAFWGDPQFHAQQVASQLRGAMHA